MESSGVQGDGFFSSTIESSLGEECCFLSATLKHSGAMQSVFWVPALTLLDERLFIEYDHRNFCIRKGYYLSAKLSPLDDRCFLESHTRLNCKKWMPFLGDSF
jgi:hypothetical protein